MMALHRLVLMTKALSANWVRTLLSMLSVAIAISSLILTLSLNRGAALELNASAASGVLVTIKAGKVQPSPGRGGMTGWLMSSALRQNDITSIKESIAGVGSLIPVSESTLRVHLNGHSIATVVRGVGEGYLEARGFVLAKGVGFTAGYGQTLDRVAIVGSSVVKKLSGGRGVLGETLLIGGVPFEVVGELQERGIGRDGANEDDQIIVPLTAAMRRLDRRDYYSSVLILAAEDGERLPAQDALTSLLRRNHRLSSSSRDDFDILYPVKEANTARINREFLLGLSRAFTLVTVLISACGIFAVMYLAAKERVPEIGLRIAVGATRANIRRLFLVESGVLSAVGGILGLALGAAAIAVLTHVTDWKMTLDASDIAMPLAAAFILGPACGVGPAIRASLLDPVLALTAS